MVISCTMTVSVHCIDVNTMNSVLQQLAVANATPLSRRLGIVHLYTLGPEMPDRKHPASLCFLNVNQTNSYHAQRPVVVVSNEAAGGWCGDGTIFFRTSPCRQGMLDASKHIGRLIEPSYEQPRNQAFGCTSIGCLCTII
jgi:hypothetical protein